MKKGTLTVMFLFFIALSSFGNKKYTLTKSDFVAQFNDTCKLKNVFCQNEKGQKVWLFSYANTILTITLENNKKENLLLQSVKLIDGKIEATKFNIWMPSQKVSKFDLKDVSQFYIEANNQENERPYFNSDSVRALLKVRNDSIRNQRKSSIQNTILIFKNNKQFDTIRVSENACYNFTFNDGTKTEYGVVQKINQNSISVSNYFNPTIAEKANQPYKILEYPIKSLKSIDLLKSGGYSFNSLEITDNLIFVENEKQAAANIPFWFAMNPMTGEVGFYRLWRTDNGYSGVKEKDGRMIWYEGEPTQ